MSPVDTPRRVDVTETEKPSMAEKRSPVMQAFTWFVTTLFVVILAAAGLVPLAIGGKPLTVLTGSMSPALEPGDLIVVRPVKQMSDIATGDIITYASAGPPSEIITHRVIGVGANGLGGVLTLRGDANNTDDEPIQFDQVRGKFVYKIPKAGWAVEYVRSNILLVGGALIVLWGGSAIFRKARKRA